ncbi:amino acid ABC transporter permease [Desulfosoma caldarium]|uniref:Amino acid ABC transporter membrane protein 2 (PAAT family) n=1 Tax=Desulfosoma caldarium TaxID=610254 RepID=A0A3N1VK93_9BACT|nr:amino acid ABC transporter permease [Desulfosoma caldarium]ROR03236.1 amino acid ABC transporter membrane protein 2 (PAAT family) [Desulfosoma caldarium]
MWLYYLKQLAQTLPFFLKGLWMTVAVSGLSLVMGTVIGCVTGIVRAFRVPVLGKLLFAYVDFMRGTPFLVQVFIIFFILPEWGVHLEAFTAAVVSLTLYAAAYICEIVAAGLLAVPSGQMEAAKASGLNWFQRMRYVIVPQAIKTILPPLVGQYVLLIKDSSVVSVIGVTDVTRVGWFTVQRIPEGLMVFGLVGLLYFAVCYPLIHLANYLEKKLHMDFVGL